MNDLISRQAAIDAICKACSMEGDYHKCDGYPETSTWCDELVALRALPSAQPIECRKQGEWDMFELITSAWYGKQYYFKEENGMAYSRKSHKTMMVDDAILEFMREIGDE